MGDKTEARRLMAAAGVPMVPGSPGPSPTRRGGAGRGGAHRLPADPQGGRRRGRHRHGARRATPPTSPAAFATATRRAQSAFGNGGGLLERYLERPRHVEVQVFADAARHGRAPARARVLDPAPAPEARRGVAGARARPGDQARARRRPRCAGARAIGYVNAGTMEFLVDAAGHFYFLEMNTRLQVEHPVTEEVTGLDLVRGAAPGGGGRAAVVAPGRRSPSAAPPSSAASTPRTPTRTSCRRPGRSRRLDAARPARGSASSRAWRRAASCPCTTTRCSSSSSRAATHRDAAIARMRAALDAMRGRGRADHAARSCRGCWSIPTSGAASHTQMVDQGAFR